uniref:Uncharacterized protein n=1 Tax=Candidatus Kentrum sp. UNK TaxID=2126344 RepID=A0A451AJN9_9GAMM|nr:MAG: hypothetical protein BECKUNK1418G_GA0071005_10855 [Candidatus Kentron sp. UNK]VFK71890.1 MAG: hypothetical protein BECKUNK1418H_GA0071006_10865 [Candidatus Kentron sp. UNK]
MRGNPFPPDCYESFSGPSRSLAITAEKSNRGARRSPRSAEYNLAIPESVIFPLASKLELGNRQESDLEIPASLLVPTMSGLGYPPLPGR